MKNLVGARVVTHDNSCPVIYGIVTAQDENGYKVEYSGGGYDWLIYEELDAIYM